MGGAKRDFLADSSSSDDDLSDIITLGQSTEFKPMRWRFPDSRKCPNDLCGMTFSSRIDARTHFCIEHADICMLCTICDKLFPAKNKKLLLVHFENQHPYKTPPQLKLTKPVNTSESIGNQSNGIQSNENRSSADDYSEDSDGEYIKNDLITLKGCGQTTMWKFPHNAKSCPVDDCLEPFGVRSDAIWHFMQKHADNAIYCSICNIPITVRETWALHAAFVQHYNDLHPNKEVPFNLDKYIKPKHDSSKINEEETITLGGCGGVTTWTIPQNTKQCPNVKCHQKFEDRSDLIVHYKEKHAKSQVFCSLCNKPICCPYPSKLSLHYDSWHPNKNLPFGLAVKTEPKPSSSRNCSEIGDEVAREEEDDLITLTGCGQITMWRFPSNITHCPVQRCESLYETRSQAIRHYKRKHAHMSILCPICVKPICTHGFKDFINHYKSVHRNEEIPYNFKQKIQSNDKEARSSQTKYDENNDNLITLSGCGIETKWRFPHSARCPVRNCRIKFHSRSTAIQHYKKEHAKHSILCSICEEPKIIRKISEMAQHFRKTHPGEKMPSYLNCEDSSSEAEDDQEIVDDSNTNTDTNSSDANNCADDEANSENEMIAFHDEHGECVQWRFPPYISHCPACGVAFKSRSMAIAHYKAEHTGIYDIFCHECKKPVVIRDMKDLKRHYKTKHPDAKQPNDFVVIKPKPKDEQEEEFVIELNSSSEDEKRENRTEANEQSGEQGMVATNNDQETPIVKVFRCKACTMCFPNEIHRDQHMESIHNPGNLLCPLRDCMFESENLESIHEHWEARHGHLRFPIIQNETRYTYNISASAQQSETQMDTTKEFDEQDGSENSLLIPLKSVVFTDSPKKREISHPMVFLPDYKRNRSDDRKELKQLAKKRCIDYLQGVSESNDVVSIKEVQTLYSPSSTIVKDPKESGETNAPDMQTFKTEQAQEIDVDGDDEENQNEEITMQTDRIDSNIENDKTDNDYNESYEEDDVVMAIDLSTPVYVLDSDEEEAAAAEQSLDNTNHSPLHVAEMHVLMMAKNSIE